MDLILGLRKVPWSRKWQPTLVCMSVESHGQSKKTCTFQYVLKIFFLDFWLCICIINVSQCYILIYMSDSLVFISHQILVLVTII